MPDHWSVKDALSSYLNENGFTVEEYDADVVRVTFWGITFPVPNPPQRKIAVRFHDLHHIMTGFGTDPTGEGEISAWELRRGVGVFGFYVRCIVFFGAVMGCLHSPRRTLKAWRAARSSLGLRPATMAGYLELLELTVGDLRAMYDVSSHGIAGAHKLHYDVPSVENQST
ncbi:MAG: hypothetical protein VYA34_02885 [Myxococcota bacterium]|nr:hypothetical protein [Myxococcota bacterium]